MRNLLFIIILSLMLFNCTTKCKVEDLTASEIELIPYHEYQKITFKDSLNNILVFKCGTFTYSKISFNTSIGFRKEERIEKDIKLELDSTSTYFNLMQSYYSPRIKLVIFKSCEGNKASVSYNLSNFFCYSGLITFYFETEIDRSVADTTINNVSYKDVFVYTKNNLKNCFSDRTKFLINKKNGLIQFRDNNEVLWTLDK